MNKLRTYIEDLYRYIIGLLIMCVGLSIESTSSAVTLAASGAAGIGLLILVRAAHKDGYEQGMAENGWIPERKLRRMTQAEAAAALHPEGWGHEGFAPTKHARGLCDDDHEGGGTK